MSGENTGAVSPSSLPPLRASREQPLTKPMGRSNRKGMNPYIFQSMNTAKMRAKSGHAATMQSLGVLSELQDYISTVEAVASEHKEEIERSSHDKALGKGNHPLLDFHQSELSDMAPRTRAVFEENRVLRETLKKYKARNYELDTDRTKKQNKILSLEEDITLLKHQLEACSRTPEQVQAEEDLKNQVLHRDAKIEALMNDNQVLQHKIAVDGRMSRQASKSCAQEKNALKRQLQMAHEANLEKDKELRAALLQIKRLQKKLSPAGKMVARAVEPEPPAKPEVKAPPKPEAPAKSSTKAAEEDCISIADAASKLQAVFWLVRSRQEHKIMKQKEEAAQKQREEQCEKEQQQRKAEELRVKREQAMALAEAARQQAIEGQQAAANEAPEEVAPQESAPPEPSAEEAPVESEPEAQTAVELPPVAPQPPKAKRESEGFQHGSAPRAIPYGRTAARAASRKERSLSKSESQSSSTPSSNPKGRKSGSGNGSRSATPPTVAPVPEAVPEPIAEEQSAVQQETVEGAPLEQGGSEEQPIQHLEQPSEQQYDAEGNPIQMQQEQQYDAEGKPIVMQQEQQYDAEGNPIQMQYEQQYDAEGNPILIQYEQQYDAEGNPIHYDIGSAGVTITDVTHPAEDANLVAYENQQDALQWQVQDPTEPPQ